MDLRIPLLLGNTFLLGLRHGVDWDHIAAILDITGTTTTQQLPEGNSINVAQNAFSLSFLYALGHGSVVVLLGIAAILFSTILPAWIDPIMQRAVGVTLIILSLAVFVSLFRFASTGNASRLQSRWMLIFAGLKHATGALHSKLTGTLPPRDCKISNYEPGTAFAVGMIHGIGAETGTQVLLIASLAGTNDSIIGSSMMLAFVAGLVCSNALIAIVSCAGFMSCSRIKLLYAATAVASGTFGMIVGILFALGADPTLPDLSHLLGHT